VNVGIICYASVGGSGVVATELATALARRGHDVHILSSETPFRLRDEVGLSFHKVDTPAYPLFREPQYLLSLATKIVQVSRSRDLDIVHAHYAVPHAAAAYLAKQIIADSGRPTPGIVTTLHGTDITLVGRDPSYSETVAYCIDQADIVTAVSQSLKADTYRALRVRRPIEVIPNFLDCERYRRIPVPGLRKELAPDGRPIVAHISNFRPVKRIDAVVEVFRRMRAVRPLRLLLVGDGPDLGTAQMRIAEHGLQQDVEFRGELFDVSPILSATDLLLLPSAQESFGLAALEAMACEVPVVASAVGGLPEVIEHGRTGFLHPPDDLAGMAASGLAVLDDDELRTRITGEARRTVAQRFCTDVVVPRYEACYERLVTRAASRRV
jgi:N-acetyl-alpha-D-glucosaminyl L-malate synthase BshA